MSKIKMIQTIDALHIPYELHDACMDISDEFPLHYSNGIVRIYAENRKNLFVQWLLEQGWTFDNDGNGYIGVWGT